MHGLHGAHAKIFWCRFGFFARTAISILQVDLLPVLQHDTIMHRDGWCAWRVALRKSQNTLVGECTADSFSASVTDPHSHQMRS